jgi:hypothetical protein
MSPDDIYDLKVELKELRESVAVIEMLQREANGRLGKIEGRVFEIELWRARLQGVAATSRIVWLVAGAGITAIVVGIIQRA